MKRFSAFSLFIIVMMILSCEKELDVKLIPENPLLVLNCAVVSDSTWLVSLTRTGNILDYIGNITRVNNAEITIRNEGNAIIETLENFSLLSEPDSIHYVFRRPPLPSNYNYRGKTIPVAGQTYSIYVKVDGENDLKAQVKIPLPVTLTSVEIDSFRYASARDVEMTLKFQDPIDEKNHYQIKIYRDMLQIPSTFQNGTWKPDSSKAYSSTYNMPYHSVGLVNELYSNDLFTDDLFNGKNHELRLLVQNFQADRDGYPVHVVLVSINKEYYDYFSSVKLANDAQGNPLLQPVQIYTNIENGLGIFAGYSVSEILFK